MRFSLSDDDFFLIVKSLAAYVASKDITIGEAADAFDLIVKIEGLTDPTKELEHLASSWDAPLSEEDMEL